MLIVKTILKNISKSTQWELLGPTFTEHGALSQVTELLQCRKFSWIGETDPIQPIEIISHLIGTPCMMLKFTGLGCFAETESLPLTLDISEKKRKSSLQLNITKISRKFLSFRMQRSQLVLPLHKSRM